MRNGEGKCGFTGAWGSYEEQRASRELAGLDKFDNHPTRFASIVLPYETGTVTGS
jgi:hypothetical protein